MNVQRSGGPGRVTLVRDIGSWVLGVALMLIQSGVPGWFPPPEHPNDTLTWIAAILISAPGAAGAWNVIATRFSTIGPSSSPPAPESSQSSSSSS